MIRKCKVLIIYVLVFSILLSITQPVFATKSSTIYINNINDLNNLSRDSSIDSWSKGKTIVLNNNIDLKGKEFIPIPIFNGIFEGNGYTIKGLVINVEGSNQGFFRYLQEDGVIRNLTIEATVIPKGDRSNIGGIVGSNSGRVENCVVSGYIKGKENIGGIVGWNGSSGKIINSSYNGIIYGESTIGGIAGFNNGSIIRSNNESNVNTTVEETTTNIQNIKIDDFSLEKLVNDAINIGGITGVNTGVITGCVNRGLIGHSNVGYNVGGISGKQSGYINDCQNYGTIRGRRKVGGIVGQMEPHVKLVIPLSKLEKLKTELNSMEATSTRLINNMRNMTDLMNKNFAELENGFNSSMTNIQSLINQLENIVGDGIEEIDLIFAEIMNLLTPFIESIPEMVESIETMVKYFNELIEYLSNIFVDSPELVEKLENLINLLGNLITDMNDTIKWLNEAHRISKEICNSKEHFTKDQIIQLVEYLKNAKSSIGNTWNTLTELMDYLSELIETGDFPQIDLENILNQVKSAIDSMKGTGLFIDEIITGISNLIDTITNQPNFEFETIGDIFLQLKDGLFSSINNMSSSIFNLMDIMGKQGNLMIDDMEKLNNQMFGLMDLMVEIIEEISAGDVNLEDIVQDISSEEVEKTTEGKVSNSENNGDVKGDINVGGIAGAMSIDFTLDPERDLALGDKLSINSVFQTRAVILGCINKGNIKSKKDNIGGIVGNMDLGYIKSCISSGTIESLDGDYVGGIAGKSVGPIESSFAKNLLKGGNNIGGISGYGKNIKDSYTLVKVGRNKARVGAIAGDVEDRKNIKDNYFVSEDLRGIDSISYSGEAEPIYYEELISRDGMPAIFKEFKISFWIGDKLVDTIDFSFGDSIPKNELPKIPKKDGYFGRWQEIDTEKINFDLRVDAEYFPYLTVIESTRERKKLPIVLVEGQFTDEDFLILTQNKLSSEDKENNLEEWILKIPNNGQEKNIVRFNPPSMKKNLNIYILKDGNWKKTRTKRDGKYIVFETKENNIKFRVAKGNSPYIKYLNIAIFAAFTISIIIIVKKREKEIGDLKLLN